jgi:hypothetical protein
MGWGGNGEGMYQFYLFFPKKNFKINQEEIGYSYFGATGSE